MEQPTIRDYCDTLLELMSAMAVTQNKIVKAISKLDAKTTPNYFVPSKREIERMRNVFCKDTLIKHFFDGTERGQS